MTESFVLTLGRDAIMTTLVIGSPLLGMSLLIGLVVSLFQAVTQINEMTLTFVPKLLGLGLVLLIGGSWMLQQLLHFTATVFEMIPFMVR